MNDLTLWLGVLMVLAFVVNIIVQLTKGFVSLPTKLWCIIVSAIVDLAVLIAGASANMVRISAVTVVLSVIGAFIVAYVAMYGFDTFKSMWERFRKGENINEQK